MNYFKQIIKKICKENNIKCKFISKNWIIVLEKDDKISFITGYKFDINNYAVGLLADDKFATYEFLNSVDIPVVYEKIFYSPTNNNDYAVGSNSFDDLFKVFSDFNNNIVLKQNNGTLGNDIYHITDKENLEKTYNYMINKYFSIDIGPYYDIDNEYRVIMLDNNPKLIYKKIRPVVFGNGEDTIEELLKKFNYNYFENIKIENNYILKKGEKYEYNWKFNLSSGAKASFEISDNVKNIVENMAKEVTQLLGIRFCSVDIIKTSDDKYYVMEVNSGVMMNGIISQFNNGYDIAKGIYEEVIKKMID